jgi:3',5'-cyclic AMP phosphodiesterase CpdA
MVGSASQDGVLRLAWATDIHLDFVAEARAAQFCSEIARSPATALLLGGDIADARSLERWLSWMRERLPMPVYFVLGNHDYYGGAVEAVRALARRLSSAGLAWLPSVGVVPLGERWALVGHDGWGDARLGDFLSSPVVLNDYIAIRELVEAAGTEVAADDPLAAWELKTELRQKLGELGDDAAATLRPHLLAALDDFEEVLVLTHVPPFREACWHRGSISGDDWLPGFTCKAMGDMLIEAISRRPERKVTVLCGHTHGEGETWPLPNLRVRTGRAVYGEPRFELLELPDAAA